MEQARVRIEAHSRESTHSTSLTEIHSVLASTPIASRSGLIRRAGSFVNSNGTCLAASNPGLLRAARADQSVVAPPVYATVAAEMT